MARATPYILCRYGLFRNERALTPADELKLLEKLIGERIAYRVRDAKPDDADTYIAKVRHKTVAGRRVHTWEIMQDLKFRETTRYDKSKDETSDEIVPTRDEVKHTKFLAVPSLNALAVEDRFSDRSLGARSAVGRFAAILERLAKLRVSVSFAGTPQDVQRALDTWSLDQFSFTIRPFNPSPSKPGDRLDELLTADNVGSMRAVTYPSAEHNMKDSHEGIISEAKGLSDAGYGQIGAKGTTPDGLKATIDKPKFEIDKQKNVANQSKNRILKVYIDANETEDDDERALVKSLIELYGDAETTDIN